MSDSWGYQITGPIAPAGTLIDVLINNDLDPAAHCVTLFRDELSVPPQLRSGAYHAEVSFGAGAVTGVFLCDWRGQFSIVCSRIAVRARSYGTRIVPPLSEEQWSDSPATTPRYRHGAVLGVGGLVAAKPLTFTGTELLFAPPLISEEVSLAIAVPSFGRRFFPRIARMVNQAGTLPVRPGVAPLAYLEQMKLVLTAPGSYPGSSVIGTAPSEGYPQPLTPEICSHGLDVGDSGFVTLTMPVQLVQMGLRLLVTPLFELGL